MFPFNIRIVIKHLFPFNDFGGSSYKIAIFSHYLYSYMSMRGMTPFVPIDIHT